MNLTAALVAAIMIAATIWMLLTGGLGEAMSRRLCGDGLASVPCVLVGVVLTYLLPLLAGIVGGVVVWIKLARKQGK